MTEIKVLKRNGKTVDFNITKIENAILYAMNDINYEDKESVSEIIESVQEQIEDIEEEIITVEEIQEIVVAELYSVDRKLGKVYNDYRNKKNANRTKQQEGLLSDEFISKYKHLPDPFPTDMSSFVFYRTYSRFLPKENRRERWWEVVKRVVEYNCSLAPTSVEEAEKLYDNIYNLRQFPSGRSLWVGGTEVSKKYPQANFNCSFSVLDEFDAFVECYYLLLIGAGVGFRVLPDDVAKLPKIRKDIEVIDMYYKSVPKGQRKEFTELVFPSKDIAKIIIGDSKEGWVKSLDMFLKLHYDSFYRDIKTILINYDNIRPAGEPLKTFGGTASGHSSVQLMFNKISKIIKNCANILDETYVKLKPIDCTDIANIIGENVVSGGVRRTAEIILFDEHDKEMIDAKTNLYTLKDGKWVVNQDIIHRSMSNNSIYYRQKPTREQIHWQIETMRYSGEPAFINAESASKRRPNYQGNNACSEILLDNRGMCNLTEIIVPKFIEDGKLNEEKLYEAQRLSARMSYRMGNVDFELYKWDYISKRDHLTGCSMSGWQDAMNILQLSKEEQKRILNNLRQIATDSANQLADELGLNRPVLTTTLKPSGTISLLPNVSAGIHYSHSENYIRRVRINAFDPLAYALKDIGYNLKPEDGQTLDNAKTLVVEFPMKAPKGKTKYNVSAIEQLENYKFFMENYVNHNVSITVHVRDNEWEEVEQWLWDNWDSVVAISFIPLSDAMYNLMPYEEISEEQYEELLKQTPKFNPSVISKFEKGDDFEIAEADCDSGICPIR